MEYRITYAKEPDPRVVLEELVEDNRVSVKDLCSYINNFLSFDQLREFNDHIKQELGLDDLDED